MSIEPHFVCAEWNGTKIKFASLNIHERGWQRNALLSQRAPQKSTELSASTKRTEATAKALYLQAPDPFPHVELQPAIELRHFLSPSPHH